MATKEDYLELVWRVKMCDYHYFVSNDPLVSDGEYDKLYAKLKMIESEHPEWVTWDSPTQVVGSDLTDGEKIVHLRRMLSISKVYKYDECRDFVYGKCNGSAIAEYKYDGLSVSLIYVDGILASAATRGDGSVGMDVTENVKHILSIPHDLRDILASHNTLFGNPHIFEVRGEVLMTYTAFNNINKNKRANGQAEYTHPRGGASGLLTGSSPKACNMLTFMAYDAYSTEYKGGEKQSEVLDALRGIGFKVAKTEIVSSSDVECKIESMGATRESLAFPIDGIVLKANDRDAWKTLGANAAAPHWAVAFKFETKEYMTKYLGVEWTDNGDTGRLTPVILFNEVEMYGKKCSRISLGSYKNFMEKMDGIRVGDKLIITMGGECVPVLKRWYSIGGDGEAAVTPVVCPICGTPVVQDGRYLRCPRPDKHAAARAQKDKADIKELRINDRALSGMSIVVSGEYTKRYTREQVRELVEKAGGILRGGISGATAFMVAGDVKPGPSKLEKCAKFGIPVLTEDEFLRKIVNG